MNYAPDEVPAMATSLVLVLVILTIAAPVGIVLLIKNNHNTTVKSYPYVESMRRHGHTRTLTVWKNGNGTFIGENNHKLWWDASQQYWFCGMNTSNIKMFDSGLLDLPLKFDSLRLPPIYLLPEDAPTVEFKGPAHAYLRDGRETAHYKNLSMIVVAVQDASEEGNLLDPTLLGVNPIDGLSVDINFAW